MIGTPNENSINNLDLGCLDQLATNADVLQFSFCESALEGLARESFIRDSSGRCSCVDCTVIPNFVCHLPFQNMRSTASPRSRSRLAYRNCDYLAADGIDRMGSAGKSVY